MLRTLTWHLQDGVVGTGRQGPTYYIEQDYTPVSVQIYADIPPDADDLEVDILDDGVSILNSYAGLAKSANEDDIAGDFKESTVIDAGSWVHMNVIDLKGAKNVSVHLILETVTDDVAVDASL